MLVRMNTHHTGTLSLGDETVVEWPERGGLIDLPEAVARHEIEAGHATEVTDREATADRPTEAAGDGSGATPAGDAGEGTGADAGAPKVTETARQRKARERAEAAGS